MAFFFGQSCKYVDLLYISMNVPRLRTNIIFSDKTGISENNTIYLFNFQVAFFGRWKNKIFREKRILHLETCGPYK